MYVSNKTVFLFVAIIKRGFVSFSINFISTHNGHTLVALGVPFLLQKWYNNVFLTRSCGGLGGRDVYLDCERVNLGVYA